MNRPTSFALHIGPLFTRDQRECMSAYIDLADQGEVAGNAQAILSRLQDHSMPADGTGPWPDEWIALFARWMAEGCPG